MIRRLVILGATGDLTGRYLLPGLAALRAAGHLGDGFELVGLGREKWTGDEFVNWAASQLDAHAADLPAQARNEILAAARYPRADVTNPADMAAAIDGTEPVAAYLALPPSVFAGAVCALHRAGTAPGSTVVLEKPFSDSLTGAVELNRKLRELYPERAIFRVDHFLAMTTVQNLLGVRLANRILEPIWNSAHIASVDIVWDESLALEGRARYYDGVGALKDMLQNHLLQLLCLVAMEPPISLNDRDLRDRKVDVLRSVRPLRPQDAVRQTRRARYASGQIGSRTVPAYTDEEGVDARHGTETFAEMCLEVDNWRWAGTVFNLRTGKALRRDRREVAVHFRQVPHVPFGKDIEPESNVLRFGLEPETVALHLAGVGSQNNVLAPLTLTAKLEPADLPPYARLLLDVLHGDSTLSIRADEAEESWRIATPVLDAWDNDLVPMEEYPAGSDGPEPR